jgi:hypothetical protein
VTVVLYLLGVFVLGGLFAAYLAVSISRIRRRGEPREQQMARLAAQLDGRDRVSIRSVELGLSKTDLDWVARGRGYALAQKNQFSDFYVFVRLPHQFPPGFPGPWQGRP